MMKYKSYETERLILKPTTKDDAAFILQLMNTEAWLKYIGDRNIATIEQAAVYIEKRMLPQLQKLGYGNFTVFRKSDGVKMGTAGLYDREGLEGIDIGFAFMPEFGRKGYAFEAANKIKQLALEEFKLSKINAITTQDNFASQKLLKKLEFDLQGSTKIPGDKEELLLYVFEL